jgi:hypothetical protein
MKFLTVLFLLQLSFNTLVNGQFNDTRIRNTGDIYAPVVVGTPPDNPFNSLVLLPDGEIRHYGFEGKWKKRTNHLYIYSRDNGFTWNKKLLEDSVLFTSENEPPAIQSPYSGDFIRLISNKNGTFVLRSQEGIDGKYQKTQISSASYSMIRQPLFLKSINRLLVTCNHHFFIDGQEILQACVFLSDDDGYTWEIARVPVGPYFGAEGLHEKPRWQNYAIEPTITELSNGRLWMLLRTSTDNLYQSFSDDHGNSWSLLSPSRFYSTLTMPTFLRMKDGRLLLIANFTTPLPELDRSDDPGLSEPQKTGLWEDVFTNRDVLHAAISEDDGKTWIGFRELYLNPLRNTSDFATIGGNEVSLDKSVHQSQAIELPDGKVLVALGQHPLVRVMVMFDPDWLYDKVRTEDFSSGLSNWSTFKYIDGIKGHCAYNRVTGAKLVNNPENNGSKVIRICRPSNPELVGENEGAVWNFPAGEKGTLSFRILLVPGGKGGQINLIDRWFNPTDTLVSRYSMYNFRFDGDGKLEGKQVLKPGIWQKVTLEWNDSYSKECKISIDGEEHIIPLNRSSVNGINYVHFQSTAKNEDIRGFLIDAVNAAIDRSDN